MFPLVLTSRVAVSRLLYVYAWALQNKCQINAYFLVVLLLYHFRSRYGTPVFSILCSATGVIALSWMRFQEVVEFVNFLYCFGMLLEFAAFIWLRVKQPELLRPYKVPLNTACATLMCIPPSALLILVMCLASMRTFLVSMGALIVGLLLYPVLQHVKKKKWLRFSEKNMDLPSSIFEQELGCPIVGEHKEHPVANIGLLMDYDNEVSHLE